MENRITVQVDFDQKLFSGGLQTAKQFEKNYRDRQPVMCKVVVGNRHVPRGTILLVHHNFFHENSPYQIRGDLFSIYANENIFARLDEEGNPLPAFGNIMAERIEISSELEVSPEYKKFYSDRVRVIETGSGFHKGNILLIRRWSDYEIIYNWKGEERRVIKVPAVDVLGKILKIS